MHIFNSFSAGGHRGLHDALNPPSPVSLTYWFTVLIPECIKIRGCHAPNRILHQAEVMMHSSYLQRLARRLYFRDRYQWIFLKMNFIFILKKLFFMSLCMQLCADTVCIFSCLCVCVCASLTIGGCCESLCGFNTLCVTRSRFPISQRCEARWCVRPDSYIQP